MGGQKESVTVNSLLSDLLSQNVVIQQPLYLCLFFSPGFPSLSLTHGLLLCSVSSKRTKDSSDILVTRVRGENYRNQKISGLQGLRVGEDHKQISGWWKYSVYWCGTGYMTMFFRAVNLFTEKKWVLCHINYYSLIVLKKDTKTYSNKSWPFWKLQNQIKIIVVV